MGPLNSVLDPGSDSGSASIPANQLAYLTTQDATAGAIVGPTPDQGTYLRQTWTLWLDGDAVPDEVNATLWSSPDGSLWAPVAQFQKRKPGPGGDVFEVPIASYFYVTVDQSWPGNPSRPAVNSAIQSAR